VKEKERLDIAGTLARVRYAKSAALRPASLLRRLASHEAGGKFANALSPEHGADPFGDRQLDAEPVGEVA
jgi:hypothetical protein